MNRNIRILQDIFDHTLEVFIETIAFGIENKVLVFDREETLIVCFRTFRQRVVEFQLLVPAGQRLQLFAGRLQSFIIDIFLRIDGFVHQPLLNDRHQVAGNPIECDTGRNKHAKI